MFTLPEIFKILLQLCTASFVMTVHTKNSGLKKAMIFSLKGCLSLMHSADMYRQSTYVLQIGQHDGSTVAAAVLQVAHFAEVISFEPRLKVPSSITTTPISWQSWGEPAGRGGLLRLK